MKFTISPTTETNLRSLAVFAGILTLAGFVGSFVAAGTGIIASLALTITCSATVLWFSREIALWLMNAKEIKANEKPEGFDLVSMVEALRVNPEIQLKTMPKICIIESDKINAFATGRHQNHTAIAITTGLLKKAKEKANGDMALANKWIKAIWCHELGHIVNHDIATKTTISIFASALRIFSESIYKQRRAREDSNKHKDEKEVKSPSFLQKMGEYILLYWLVPFSGTLLSLSLSRTREFAADDVARKCGHGQDLADAFDNLLRDTKNNGDHGSRNIDALASMMCMSMDAATDTQTSEALKTEKSWVSWTCLQYKQFTATHPPIQDRIERLTKNSTTDCPESTSSASILHSC
tara:strand:+ start:162615 stop:163673 length:1059 start_codon:yes stop_codon:yes gene_type:complete